MISATFPWILSHPFPAPAASPFGASGQPPLPELRGRRIQRVGRGGGAALDLGRRQRAGPGGTAEAAGGHDAEPGGRGKSWFIGPPKPMSDYDVTLYKKYLNLYFNVFEICYSFFFYFFFFFSGDLYVRL